MFNILENGTMPTKGSSLSACVDLYSSEDCIIEVGKTAIVGLGVSLDINELLKDMIESGIIPNTYPTVESFLLTNYLQLNPRSSLRAKGIMSHTGIIDIDFVPSCTTNYMLYNGECGGFKQKSKV